MKKLKKLMCLIAALCLAMSFLTAGATDASHDDDNIDADMGSNRIALLKLLPGSGTGEVGYGGSEKFGYEGPDAFAVEDGAIFILDSQNDRIVVWRNGEYSSINIELCPRANHMKYQNQRLGVVDNYEGVTGVYTTEGELVTLIKHPISIINAYVAELSGIGDSYVIWKTYRGNYYRYDWVDGTLEMEESPWQKVLLDEGTLCITDVNGQVEWNVYAKNRIIEVLSISDDELIYQQYQFVTNVDLILAELSLRKITADGEETYTIIDISAWHTHPLEPCYLSTDGKVYVMECLEECTVVSEVVFGTADISHMGELEARAKERREELALAEAADEINDIKCSYTSSRVVGYTRAIQRAAIA